MDMKILENKKNRIILIMIAIFMIAIVLLLIYVDNADFEKILTLPQSTLSSVQNETTYKASDKLPLTYLFEDIEYAIDVPSKGILYVEGGYVYSVTEDIGLVVAELSMPRTILSYSNDLIPSLYATQEEAYTETLSTGNGYINGYEADYSILKIYLSDTKTNVYEIAYLVKCGEENVFVCATTLNATTESLAEGKSLCDSIISTLSKIETSKEVITKNVETTEIVEEAPIKDEDDTFKEASVVAENDYDVLRLSFIYMDVTKTPELCEVTDAKGNKCPISEVTPGRVTFLISDVKSGDLLYVKVKASDLKGCTVEQIEDSVYRESIDALTAGENVHVEGENTEAEE